MATPKLLKVESLFVTPLFLYEAPNYEALNSQLVEECLAIQEASGGVVRSNHNGWHSDTDLFRRKEPGLSNLCQFLAASLFDVIQRTTRPGVFRQLRASCKGWININQKGAMNIPHVHPTYVWSGTYYVRVPVSPKHQGGDIEFLDPRTNVNAVSPTLAPFQAKRRLTPRSGTALIFPSYLQHWVYPNEEDEVRISIAFNCRLHGKANDKESTA